MTDHDLPACPDLRRLAVFLMGFLTKFDEDFTALTLEIAREIPGADAEKRFWELIELSGHADARPNECEKVEALALALMRVHRLAVQSSTTQESISICDVCGGVLLLRPTLH